MMFDDSMTMEEVRARLGAIADLCGEMTVGELFKAFAELEVKEVIEKIIEGTES